MVPYHLPLDAQYASMPWDEIDTVVFDVGNVLVAFQPQRILEEVFPGDPEKHALLLDKVFHSPCWIMLDRGTLSLDEAADAMGRPGSVPAAGHPPSAGRLGRSQASHPEAWKPCACARPRASAA